MKTLILIPLFLFSIAFGQGLLPGLVTYQNSGNQPVPGALVKAGITNRAETDTDGTFSLSIPGKQSGYEILLGIEKEGYEVVNKKELFTTLRADAAQRVKFYLCPEGEWERNALAYYQINEGPITQKYTNQVARIRRDLADQEQLMVDSLAALAEQYKIALAQADELAEKFAIANLDDVSDLYEEAFYLFESGKIDEALAALSDQKLSALQSRIEQEKARGKELIAIGEQKLLAAEQAIRQGIENYVLKARLCVVAFRFDEADLNFKKAVRYDSLDFQLNFEYAHFLQNQNRFQPATVQYQKALLLAKDSARTATTLNNLGVVLTTQNDYAHGIPAYEEALAIRRKLTKTNEVVYLPYVANTLNNLGAALIAQNEYDGGISAYEAALSHWRKLAKTNKPDYLPGLGNILSNLGVALADQNEYVQSRKFHEEALAIRRRLAKFNEAAYLPDVAMSLNNLGVIYKIQNNYVRCIPLFEEALAVYRKLAKTNEAVYLSGIAMALNNLGVSFAAQNDYGRSILAFEEALRAYRKLAETNQTVFLPDVAMTLNNLGNALADENDYVRGILAYEEALKIYRKLSKANEAVYLPGVGMTLNNLGIAYKNQHDYTRGILALEEALKIYRKLSKTNGAVYLPDVGMTLNNLGNAYKNQNDYTRGILALEEALGIYRKLSETNASAYLSDVARTLNNLGNVLRNQKDYVRCIPVLEEALEIRRKLSKDNEASYLPDVATSLNNLGNALTDQHDYAQGILAYKEALTIRRRLAETDAETFLPVVATTLNSLGIACFSHGQTDTAISHMEEAISIREKLAKQQINVFGISASGSMIMLGVMMKQVGDQEKAIAWWQRADSILRVCPDSDRKQKYQQGLKYYLAGKSPAQMDENSLASLIKKINAAETYDEKVELQRQVIAGFEGMYAKDSDNSELKTYLGRFHGSFAWYALFTQNYQDAEVSARRGLELTPGEVWINTNLAHALLFQGRLEEAKIIYLRFKGQAYDDTRTWNKVFLTDLDELEAAGAIPSERMKDVEKIRKLLK